MVGQTHPVSKASGGGFARQWRMVKRRWGLYLLLSIPVIYVFIFNYIPVYGVTLAFKSYDIRAGIMDSPWIGFYQIQRFTTNVKFWKILSNTLFISLYNLVAGFPIPILLAIGLTHLMSDKYRKTIQMVTYAPHFLSTVIMVGLLNQLLSLHNGLLNRMLELFGANAVNFRKARVFPARVRLVGCMAGGRIRRDHLHFRAGGRRPAAARGRVHRRRVHVEAYLACGHSRHSPDDHHHAHPAHGLRHYGRL